MDEELVDQSTRDNTRENCKLGRHVGIKFLMVPVSAIADYLAHVENCNYNGIMVHFKRIVKVQILCR